MKRYWVLYIWCGKIAAHALCTHIKSAYRYCEGLREKGFISYIKIVTVKETENVI